MEDLVNSYEKVRSKYEKLGVKLTALISQLAEDCGIKPFTIEQRSKTTQSFREKISRIEKGGKYRLVDDVTDLIGVRIVLFTLDDCAKIISAIRENFVIDEDNSVDKTQAVEDDRFGYASTHLIASLSDERKKLFEYKELVGLKCEIQIRTVLQHAWAVLDWEMRYKSEIEVPKSLRRKLFRINASLEEADEKFSELISNVGNLRLNYETQLAGGNLSVPLDRESLELFMTTSESFERFLKACEEKGIRQYPLSTGNEYPWNYLLTSLHLAGLKSIDDLNTVIQSVGDEFYDVSLSLQDTPGIAGLGQFSLLRGAALASLDLDKRAHVLTSRPSQGSIAKKEREVYLQKD